MTDTAAPGPVASRRPEGRWLETWWRVMDFKIGVVPIPVFLAILGLLAFYVGQGQVPSDILMNIAVLAVGGFACAEVGRRLPGLSNIGAAAILATFVPSYLVYAHLLPAPLTASISSFTKSSNFLYLFICAIIVGSILGMDRRTLVQGFLKIFAPLALGSLVATMVGCGVGVAFGLPLQHVLFKIVVPIMAGGVGEGALPLSIGYAAIGHHPQGGYFAEVLPPVMLGSLTAIILAGGLNYLGKLRPGLTGQGRLQVGDSDAAEGQEAAERPKPAVKTIGAALLLAVTLYLVGTVGQKLWDFPAPVTMLALAVLLKLGRLVSPDLEQGVHSVYQFFRVAVTYPLLFAIGVAMTPWDKLVAAFNAPTLITIVATVTTMVGFGFATARFLRMYPIDVAIVSACRCGQGGTGDVAILSAANRMQLMPFAQIATRIGGAITVTLALIAFRALGAA
jgi:CCS family citrate carrier protein